jgi:hypothetical protein
MINDTEIYEFWAERIEPLYTEFERQCTSSKPNKEVIKDLARRLSIMYEAIKKRL